METLKVPAKFNRCGVKIKCLKCKWQLNGKTCHQVKGKTQSLSKCQHMNQHRYNLVVSIPSGNNARRMKVLDTRNFDVAIEEMNRFRKELNIQGYQKTKEILEEVKPTFLNYATDYLDTLNGKNTPEHLKRIRTNGHISDTKRILSLFGQVLKKAGYHLEILNLNDIGDNHVGMLHHEIKNELKLSISTYNKFMRIMKSFYKWANVYKEYGGKNPFAKVQLEYEKYDNRIFTKKEFMAVLGAVSPENGLNYKRKGKRDYYRDWLVNAYKLSLETGERGEPLVSLKWQDIIELDGGIELFGIANLKPNRIKSGNDNGRYIRYIPITRSLKKLLIELGYNEKKGSDAYILEADKETSRKHLIGFISRSFTHFCQVGQVKDLTIKNLRKTYVTKLTIVMGENAKIFTGHQDVQVMQNHYLSQAYLAANLKDFDVL